MVRHKVSNDGNKKTTSSSVPPVSSKPKKTNQSKSTRSSSSAQSHLQYKFTFSALLVGLVAFVAYYGYLGYLQTRIHTPLGEAKVIQETDSRLSDRFWGSYRPGVYFGMKHRSPKSLITGFMWLIPSQLRPGNPGLRHQCQQGDDLKSYGWIEHDGVNFGVQEIRDNNMNIVTSFVKRKGGKNGGDWTARISVTPVNTNTESGSSTATNIDEIVLLFYVAMEPGLKGAIIPERNENNLSALYGNTSDLGDFSIRFIDNANVLLASHLVTSIHSMIDVSQAALQNMRTRKANIKGKWLLDMNHENPEPEDPNFFIHQVHVKGPAVMEIVYETDSFFNKPSTLAGEEYSKSLQFHRDEFNRKFERTFFLESKGFNQTTIKFAKAALSNMIGGIGHFYGVSRVQSTYNPLPVPYWPASLYSSVPSRSFFPRGFLWDEGFHLLLINKWNAEISLDIISHWLDLMNIEGWIPREQILGEEALSRVPEEFVVQKNDIANPPTLIVALADLLEREQEWLMKNHKTTLIRMWPRLTAWYNWLNRTQNGEIPTTYRWRGRNYTTLRELNPKTLASGLDDYPRASHPTDSERHVDLRCWMAKISKLMSDLAELLGYDSDKFYLTYQSLTDIALLDQLHWSETLKSYADFGLHTNQVSLKQPLMTDAEIQKQRNGVPQEQREKIRFTNFAPKLDFVNMFGYVSLFPMLLEILPAESEKLLTMLRRLDDEKLLWTPYGLRSLAANAPLYNKRNTEHDPPYWRGPIWININFLALKSLKHYSIEKGEGGELAKKIHAQLRQNVVDNIIRQYYRTGYIWEQYSDANGDGKGCRPFTGWSALAVLIMAEEY